MLNQKFDLGGSSTNLPFSFAGKTKTNQVSESKEKGEDIMLHNETDQTMWAHSTES